MAFKSRWLDIPVETPKHGPDRTDKSPFVSSVNGVAGHSGHKGVGPCVCQPMDGPANVAPGRLTCPICGVTLWCPDCGGCRRCRGEAEGFHVDRAQVKAQRDEALGRCLERLRKGHTWLTDTHLRLLEERDVYAGMERRFIVALDGWTGMEGSLREVWEYPLCVMGPGKRCPDDSPVACQACVDSP